MGSDKVPEIYAEMLRTIGVCLRPEDIEQSQDLNRDVAVIKRQCCDDVYLVLDPQKGCKWCSSCGLVHDEKHYVSNVFWVGGKPIPIPGPTCSLTITRRRAYQPLTHFKEHLRRYMGSRFKHIPDEVLNLVKNNLPDVLDRDAFAKVKKILKDAKQNTFYKEIFTIIYGVGGLNPRLEHDIYHKCIQDFVKMSYIYMKNRGKFGRHSMPSLYMVLDILLQRNEHIPHYHIPYLKDSSLRIRVEEIIAHLDDEEFIKAYGQ